MITMINRYRSKSARRPEAGGQRLAAWGFRVLPTASRRHSPPSPLATARSRRSGAKTDRLPACATAGWGKVYESYDNSTNITSGFGKDAQDEWEYGEITHVFDMVALE